MDVVGVPVVVVEAEEEEEEKKRVRSSCTGWRGRHGNMIL